MDKPEELLAVDNGHSDRHYPTISLKECRERIEGRFEMDSENPLVSKDYMQIAMLPDIVKRIVEEPVNSVSMFYSKGHAMEFTKHAACENVSRQKLCEWARDDDLNDWRGCSIKRYHKLELNIDMREKVPGFIYSRNLNEHLTNKLVCIYQRELNEKEGHLAELGMSLLTSYPSDNGMKRTGIKTEDGSIKFKLGDSLLKLPEYKGLDRRTAIIAAIKDIFPERDDIFKNSMRKAVFSVEPPDNTIIRVKQNEASWGDDPKTGPGEHIRITCPDKSSGRSEPADYIINIYERQSGAPKINCYHGRDRIPYETVTQKMPKLKEVVDNILDEYLEYEKGRKNAEKEKHLHDVKKEASAIQISTNKKNICISKSKDRSDRQGSR